ncbi:MAG: hypothetical protein RBT41_02470 [Clostridia bacterium]|jgi:hypothetical protein|nr:hypothetical protein [Clostridia bacterium]
MKKIKILALAMVFAIMLMGVGYAAWNDIITINTTVHTADFDVQFASAATGVVNHEVPKFNGDPNTRASQLYGLEAALGNNNDLVNVSVSNMYPGAIFWVKTQVKNLGEIEAKLDGFKINAGNNPLVKYLQVTGYYHNIAGAVPTVNNAGEVTGASEGAYVKILGKGAVQDYQHSPLNPDNGLPPSILPVTPLGDLGLGDTEGDQILLVFEFPFATPAEFAELAQTDYWSDWDVNFSIDFDFVQFNQPPYMPNPEEI